MTQRGKLANMRLIGVELRVQYMNPKQGQVQEEICLLPCNVTVELPYVDEITWGPGVRFNGTLHTDRGDFNIEIPADMPTYFFSQRENKNRSNVR